MKENCSLQGWTRHTLLLQSEVNMLSNAFLSLLCVSAVLWEPSWAYLSYQEQLPNGNNVQHPCKVNYRWPGLGHENPLGGGARNVFGQDFARLGRTLKLTSSN
ncbi:temptin-like [Aplysia californica]|uniref:Temptin-like n=1 Tax=Aplysia californica TaxID=6500 RepID=A0ABM1VPM6_APLCA|nr:temptin-like [Aplysia californica]